MKLYTVSNRETGIIENAIYAEDMEHAYIKALRTYGLDAIGCNIVGENGDFMMTVCKSVWAEMLNELCPTALMEDVFNYLLAGAYVRIGKMTLDEGIAKSRLWRWIIATGFEW